MSGAEIPMLCGTLLYGGAEELDTERGPFALHTFHDLSARQPLLALTHGDWSGEAPLLARVHSSCLTSESLGGADCDCADQLDGALARIARSGRGVLFYLMQEGRGAGLIAKVRDRMLVQASRHRVTTFDAYAHMGLGPDSRRYGAVAFACAALGIRAPLILLTNNPVKVDALRTAAIRVAAVEGIERAASPFNVHYLTAKSRSGHALSAPATRAAAAELPESVDVIEPACVPGAPTLIRVASYLLPVKASAGVGRVHWFRLHAYVDRDHGAERIVLTHGRKPHAVPLVYVHAESLRERFPLRGRPGAWEGALERIALRGAGTALFLPDGDAAVRRELTVAEAVAGDGALTHLLAHHLPEQIDLLTPDTTLAAALEAHGIRSAPAQPIGAAELN
ncbi:MAG: GTP cyclohydrolase II [Candidatus Binatia bacterium]